MALTSVAGASVTAGPANAQNVSGTAISAFGDAVFYGAPLGSKLAAPLAGMASTPDGKGYWLLGVDGGVFTYGDAAFYGSETSELFDTSTAMAPTPAFPGYWIVGPGGAGRVFGDVPDGWYANPASPVWPVAPVVGMAAAPSGSGFWQAGADGGVFSFGNARFYGSAAGIHLASQVVGMAATPDGRGYWLVARGGGVFTYGDARFYGSMGGKHLRAPVVGMAVTPDGHGYWLVGADGGVFTFGDAGFFGSTGGHLTSPETPVVGMAATSDGRGYWLVTTDKPVPPPTATPSVVGLCNEPGSAPSVRPSSIILACGDGNASLTDLKWSSWTTTTATATGNYQHNTCTPDCADGTFVHTPAMARLAYPIETSAGRVFAQISYTYADPTASGGRSSVTTVIPTSTR